MATVKNAKFKIGQCVKIANEPFGVCDAVITSVVGKVRGRVMYLVTYTLDDQLNREMGFNRTTNPCRHTQAWPENELSERV